MNNPYEKIKIYYENRIKETQSHLSFVKRFIYMLGTVRLVVFLLTIILAFVLKNIFWPYLIILIVAGFSFFLYLLLVYNKYQKKKDYLETFLKCDEDELKALEYDFSSFDGAPEKADTSHSYSLDLDLFGNHSLFQSINRTCTNYGRKTLISWFENTLTDINQIVKRQHFISELSQKPDFLHYFRVSGLVTPGEKIDYEEIKEFATSERFISNVQLWKIVGIIVPFIWLAAIVALTFGKLPFTFLVILYILTLAFSESQAKKVSLLQQSISKKVNILRTYSKLIKNIENEKFISDKGIELQKAFSSDKKASQSIAELARLVNELEQRKNLLVNLLLNPLWLWDIKKAIEIENWKEKNSKQLIAWIKNIGKFDAYISLGIFSFNHPDYIFPTFTEDYFEMQGKSLGHPLMNREVCVRNDIFIDKAPYFLIVTGANMAGKSTYLRTVGTNFILATIGAPVFAESLTLYPANLITSLRTSDSLNDNESYFFAELKRLKMIIDRLQNGEKLFILLDEILKGTNSIDKQKGSLALIQQFIHLKSCGIIATHDILLGKLEEEFPDNIKNFRFEADIKDDELFFSYQLRTGVAQNMNATFLMKKMGITV